MWEESSAPGLGRRQRRKSLTKGAARGLRLPAPVGERDDVVEDQRCVLRCPLLGDLERGPHDLVETGHRLRPGGRRQAHVVPERRGRVAVAEPLLGLLDAVGSPWLPERLLGGPAPAKGCGLAKPRPAAQLVGDGGGVISPVSSCAARYLCHHLRRVIRHRRRPRTSTSTTTITMISTTSQTLI